VADLDFASLIGLILCGVIVIVGILSGQSGPDVLFNFYDLSSIMITFGGSFCCVLIMSPSLKGFLDNLKSFTLVFKVIPSNEEQTIRDIIELSNIARKSGILALEEISNSLEDDFMKKGVLLIVDGSDPELVRDIMETELNSIEARHANTIGFWESLASMGPAWGMIGTLIGLINMLKQMSDVSTIGPNMAVALVTTFYGSMLANWICIPIVTKLKANNAKEIMVKEVMIEGLLSILAGENPRVIEEKLKSFLAPSRRNTIREEGGDILG
jgi:chemotaxis protein MotA